MLLQVSKRLVIDVDSSAAVDIGVQVGKYFHAKSILAQYVRPDVGEDKKHKFYFLKSFVCMDGPVLVCQRLRRASFRG